MFAVMPDGGSSVSWREVPDASPGPGEVLVEVAGAGMNRADVLQAAGHYPPPAGASDVLGLECSGRVVAVGEGVTEWREGDEACALVQGGAQAQYCAVASPLLAPVPAGMPLADAGALPEALATCWTNLVDSGRLQAGDWLLVHGGAGGIGSFAIQLGAMLGAHVIATAGGAERAEVCRRLGAEVAIDYRERDFVADVADATNGHGVDVILDVVGAAYLAKNIAALAIGGRLVVIGRQHGSRAELDLGALMAKRASITATALRPRPLAERAAVIAALREHVWPALGTAIHPVIEERWPMTQPAEAYRRMARGGIVGKLLLTR